MHPLGDYACQPRESSVVAHSLTAWYYMNGASYTNGATQSISEGAAKVCKRFFDSVESSSLLFKCRFPTV